MKVLDNLQGGLPKDVQLYDLNISKHLQEKIDIHCATIHNIEWSGVLFYKIKGSIKKHNLKIDALDFLLMDVGKVTTTEYDMTPDVARYMVDNDLVDNVFFGLIHSHNNMAAFFSGTDDATLNSEGSKMAHYLSLVVCNAGQYVARLTTRVIDNQIISHKLSYKTFGDKEIILNKTVPDEGAVAYQVVYNDLTIHKPTFSISPLVAELSERMNDLKEEAAKLEKENASDLLKRRPGYSPKSYDNNPYGSNEDFYDKNYPYNKSKYDGSGWGNEKEVNKKEITLFNRKKDIEEEDADDTESFDSSTVDYDAFTVDENTLQLFATRMFTLSMLASPATFNLDTFLKTMEKSYDDNFLDINDFTTYFGNHLDYLMGEITGETIDGAYMDTYKYKDELDDIAQGKYALELISMLTPIKNKYTVAMIDMLYKFV